MLNDLQALEEALIEQFKQLDLATKQRLMAQVEETSAPTPSDFALWLQKAQAFQESLLAKYKKDHFMSVADMVREVREERDDELLRRSGF